MRTLTRNGYLDANKNLVEYPEWVKEEMDTFWSAVLHQIKEDFQEEFVDITVIHSFVYSGHSAVVRTRVLSVVQ